MIVRTEEKTEVRMDTRDRERWECVCEEVWECTSFHSDFRPSYGLFMGLESWSND